MTANPDAPHYIEDAAQVDLRLNATGTGWEIDCTTEDYALPSVYRDYGGNAVENGECECDDQDACEAERQRVDEKVHPPTLRELLDMLADAYDYDLVKRP